jgi:multisubunit Na+/H+ antiporter MnhB subunit
MRPPLIDRWSAIISLCVLIFCWMLFWNYTGDPIGSFSAAVIAAGLVFLACIVIRMVYLTFRK